MKKVVVALLILAIIGSSFSAMNFRSRTIRPPRPGIPGCAAAPRARARPSRG